MGTGRTSTFLTPIGDPERKRVLLSHRRKEVLAAVDAVEPLLPAIERAALLVEDDLCILIREGDESPFVLGAGCVCAPSHWSLNEKLGQPITAIHERVPFYAHELAGRVDMFLSRLRHGQIVGRRNWSVHESPELFAPICPPSLGVPPPDQWLRSERQTLSRMDRSGAVLFTIRTDQVQLKDVPPEIRKRLAARLRAEPEDLIDYRDLTYRLPSLLSWLDH